MKKIIYKVWIFLLSRSIIYIFSFFSYNSYLINVGKWIDILKKHDMYIYINRYKVQLFIIFILFIILIISKIFINNSIKNARIINYRIVDIKINNIDRQLSYIGTFVLPLLASFQKIEILWLVFYEMFVFFIISKNIESYYRMIFSFLFTEYIATLESGNEILIYTNKLKTISTTKLPNQFNLKGVNISNDSLGEYIFVY